MGTLSIHSVGYIKVHLSYEQIRNTIKTLTTSLFARVKEATEKIMGLAISVLIVAIFLTAFMMFRECGKIFSLYEQCSSQTSFIFKRNVY